MWKTKRIETKLNEKQFLDRLKTFCRDKTRFDKGYNDKDVFVVKRKQNKFWLCKHYANIGRTDGYGNDCIYFRYITNKNGYIDVEYKFGKRLLFVIPFIVCFVAGIALWNPSWASCAVWRSPSRRHGSLRSPSYATSVNRRS